MVRTAVPTNPQHFQPLAGSQFGATHSLRLDRPTAIYGWHQSNCSELRTLFGKHGGELGKTGCVAYLFERKGLFLFPADCDEERITEVALENGGDDVEKDDDGQIQVTCAPEYFDALSEAFDTAGLSAEVSEISQIASTNVDVDGSTAEKVISLLEALDDHDDIQTVSTNVHF